MRGVIERSFVHLRRNGGHRPEGSPTLCFVQDDSGLAVPWRRCSSDRNIILPKGRVNKALSANQISKPTSTVPQTNCCIKYNSMAYTPTRIEGRVRKTLAWNVYTGPVEAAPALWTCGRERRSHELYCVARGEYVDVGRICGQNGGRSYENTE